MKAISVDPHIVQFAVDELDQDQRSVYIERTYDSLHRMLGQLVEKHVRWYMVRDRLSCQREGERLKRCFNPRRRCWACEDCAAVLSNSYVKVKADFEEMMDGLVSSLIEVEMEAELVRRRRWPA